jgi:exosortase
VAGSENAERRGPERGLLIRAGLLVAVFATLFLPALTRLGYVFWNDGNYSYGFFIPLVSAFYVYMNWDRLSKVQVRGSWLGLVLLVPSLLGYLFVASLNPPVPYLMRLAMLGTLVSLVVMLAGWRTLWAYAFPIGYLLVMFPLPKRFEENYITLPLQAYAARSGGAVIEAFGIPVVRDGNILRIPAMDLLVEEACSGIRSLFSLMALSIAMVFLFEKRWWEKVILLAITPVIAVVANVIRVSSTGILAEWVSPEFAKGFLHYFQGLAIFLVGMALLLLAAWVLQVLFPRAEREEPTGPREAASSGS